MDPVDSIHAKDLQVTNAVKISYIDPRMHRFSYSHLVTTHIDDPKVHGVRSWVIITTPLIMPSTTMYIT